MENNRHKKKPDQLKLGVEYTNDAVTGENEGYVVCVSNAFVRFFELAIKFDKKNEQNSQVQIKLFHKKRFGPASSTSWSQSNSKVRLH
jgi:hypothetical protein